MSKPAPHKLSDYRHSLVIPTRWADNDAYGHVNNSVYYFYFDTVVNKWLIDKGLLEIGTSEVVGLVVETGCAYFAPISFPDDVVTGLRVTKSVIARCAMRLACFATTTHKRQLKAISSMFMSMRKHAVLSKYLIQCEQL